MKVVVTLLIFALMITGLQAQFSISADISPRTELRHGYRTMPPENASTAILVNQRTRMAFGYLHENITTHISFQDVRVWGEEMQRTIVPSLALHEAWAELMFNPALSLKVGRQHLRYDNQRFFAINDWIPMGQKHDVALLKYNSQAGEIHLGTAFNQPWDAFSQNFGTEYGLNNYKYMNFLRYSTSLSEQADIALMAVADGYENPANPDLLNVRATWLAFLNFKLAEVDFMMNPALQHGKTPSGQEIQAFYFRAEGSTALSEAMTSTLGIEIFSGNDATDMDATKYRAFDALYGAGHANNGFMDYFTLIPQHTRDAGLVNPFLKNRFNLSPLTTLDADLHLFFIQGNYLQAGEPIDKYLGTELDIALSYRFNDFTRIIGGFSTMFGSESMEVIKGGSKNEPAYFGYVMLRIRPQLL